MSNWNKKPVTVNQIEPICSKYKVDKILASILVRRGITEGKDILYYLEDDLRFEHSPFYFKDMEDAVERILQAKEENEKILIFGDSDVDGVTSTAILYEYLKSQGFDVSWRLPLADDAYGLSMAAVDDFASQGGTLIITVDCGISNNKEIEHAMDKCIDVIVTDHHNPPEELPNAIVIIDPKIEDCGYPFEHISGAAVAYKLVSALRFAATDFYNAEICLMDLSEDKENNCLNIDCVKIRNLIRTKELHEKIIPGKTSIYDLKLPYFLQGQIIYVWDSAYTKNLLLSAFGSGVDFALTDLQEKVCQFFPALKGKTTNELQNLSAIGKYLPKEHTPLSAFYNLFVTYTNKLIAKTFPNRKEAVEKDLQLVALAALADIMPMKDENRIFVKNGIKSIKQNGPRSGLIELFSRLNIDKEAVTSVELSWNIIPVLNAAGRLGQSNLALELLISEDAKKRMETAAQIVELNEKRKQLVETAHFTVHEEAKKSIAEHENKLCLIVNECINPGVTGIVAAKFMQEFGVPCIAITFNNDVCIGSMRSNRGVIATDFLNNLGDIFINHGGHNFAAGFSLEKNKLDVFKNLVKKSCSTIILEPEDSDINVDAQLPPEYLTPEIFNLLETFEPYGSESGELIFMSKGIKVIDAMLVGKKNPPSLKLIFECGKYKFPGLFWGQGDRLRKDINIGQKYDILFTLNKNYFNKMFSNQLIIKELKQE